MNNLSSFICWQQQYTFAPLSRGFHLITSTIEEIIAQQDFITIGLINLFIQHTSASLTMSENASWPVRLDLENFFHRLVPENEDLYKHTEEGSDDMPAHLKNVLLGSSLTIPLNNGKLALGQWQGIFLCEHRYQASGRQLLITAQGS